MQRESEDIGSEARRIEDELARQRRLVPELGEGKRWYDPLWRVLDRLIFAARWSRSLPPRLRSGVTLFKSFFWALNSLERARIGWKGDPVHQIVTPEGEQVLLPGFWVVDFYTASHIGALERRLSRRDWRHANWTWDRLHPAQSLRRARRRTASSGWEQVVELRAAGTHSWKPDSIEARLPSGIAQVAIYAVPIGSSLTAVVAAFTLTDDAATSVNRIVGLDHRPRLRRMGPTFQVNEPLFVGLQDTIEARGAIHRLGREWMSREMPGVFAKEGLRHHPVFDLILTSQHDPFGTQHDGGKMPISSARIPARRWPLRSSDDPPLLQ